MRCRAKESQRFSIRNLGITEPALLAESHACFIAYEQVVQCRLLSDSPYKRDDFILAFFTQPPLPVMLNVPHKKPLILGPILDISGDGGGELSTVWEIGITPNLL